MTKLSWSGVVLIVCGLALLMLAPQMQFCVTDYDFTLCDTTGSAAFNVAGLALIACGVGLAFFGLERRTS